MIEDFAVGILVFLLVFYYVTVILHFCGVQIFRKIEIKVGLALIPFYYWFKRDITV
jgi:hypothetical protein